MTAALAVISAALALAPLPSRGFALETKPGVQLQTVAGRPVALLGGMNLALDQAVAHKVALRDRRGRLFLVGRDGVRASSFRRGCRTTDVSLVVCPHAIRGVTGAPSKVGHWVWAERAPTGDAILAQWSAECEIPVAYLIVDGKRRSYGAETVALGWLPSGEAVVHFRAVGCASSPRNGIYAMPREGKPRLLLRTVRFAQYLMWGG
jgi:hypothetical protein